LVQRLEYTQNKARKLLELEQYDTAAFYIHLAVEKALKTAIVALKHDEPPKVHNLVQLHGKILDTIVLSDQQIRFLRRLTTATFETKYSDVSFRRPDEIYTEEIVKKYFESAQQIIERIISKIEVNKHDQ
jgi:HEPN domain-containing protein